VLSRDDIAQGIVVSTTATLNTRRAQGEISTEYCRGVLDSARALAQRFGIAWTSLMDKLCGALSDG
jgi:hypothetical protein